MRTKNLGLVTLLSIGVLSLVGCGNSQKVTTCTLSKTTEDGTKLESVYKMTHDGKYVSLIETIEVLESDDKEVLDYYKSYFESSYEPYKNLEYYDYNIETADNRVVSKVIINYAKIDINKFMDITPASSTFITNGKVSLDSVKTIYALFGAECE